MYTKSEAQPHQNIDTTFASGRNLYLHEVIYALSDFLIMILSWLVKQSLRAFSFQEVQP